MTGQPLDPAALMAEWPEAVPTYLVARLAADLSAQLAAERAKVADAWDKGWNMGNRHVYDKMSTTSDAHTYVEESARDHNPYRAALAGESTAEQPNGPQAASRAHVATLPDETVLRFTNGEVAALATERDERYLRHVGIQSYTPLYAPWLQWPATVLWQSDPVYMDDVVVNPGGAS